MTAWNPGSTAWPPGCPDEHFRRDSIPRAAASQPHLCRHPGRQVLTDTPHRRRCPEELGGLPPAVVPGTFRAIPLRSNSRTNRSQPQDHGSRPGIWRHLLHHHLHRSGLSLLQPAPGASLRSLSRRTRRYRAVAKSLNARDAEEAGALKCPVKRVGAPQIPVPVTPTPEKIYKPSPEDVGPGGSGGNGQIRPFLICPNETLTHYSLYCIEITGYLNYSYWLHPEKAPSLHTVLLHFIWVLCHGESF